MALQMVDLQAQLASIRGELDGAIDAVLTSGAYVRGPFVQSFETRLAEYAGTNHAIGVGNGTDALQLAYMALGVGQGDEIVTTAFTFIATAEAAALLGARPVFVDIDPHTFNLDAARLADAVTDRTRAIVPVHLYGQPADMDEVRAVASQAGVPVIEDAAQAIGSHYRGSHAGSVGEIGCLSFYPSKNLGAIGDGGAVLTNDADLARRVRTIANHGGSSKYHNEVVGVNSRLDALQAAILEVKLRHLDPWTRARQVAADAYDACFEGSDVVIPHRAPNRTHVFHQYTIRVPAGARDGLQQHLRQQGIPSMVYYPVPLHRLAVFADLAYAEGSLPETEAASREVLSLPMHPHLTEEQIRHVAGVVRAFLGETVEAES
jgi:UDP-2-acetamido-2-deoxy-ribo-hexuluronate aminotransferase